jgi:hypothetical protein
MESLGYGVSCLSVLMCDPTPGKYQGGFPIHFPALDTPMPRDYRRSGSPEAQAIPIYCLRLCSLHCLRRARLDFTLLRSVALRRCVGNRIMFTRTGFIRTCPRPHDPCLELLQYSSLLFHLLLDRRYLVR